MLRITILASLILKLKKTVKMQNRLLSIVFILMSLQIIAQNNPKREFRAAWIAHVYNIDFPTSKTLTADAQRLEFTNILDYHKAAGMNAVVVQIRAACDATYPSDIEPWSEWMTGQQGRSPGYDPLAFMIAETHKRGMEFHAWFNPYRAVVSAGSSSIAASHVSNLHPDWIQPYNLLRMLDPGLPAVRQYVTSVIMDVVRRYDIDAVHFDDYFYPYPQSGFTFADDATFAANGRGITNKNDWRRDNVDLLIKTVSDSIKSVKKYVKFGISPFGIWKNQSSDPQGSATSGLQSYSDIYGDSRKWIRENWVDYMAPQLYWSIGYTPAKYEVLVPWWADNATGRHIYIGQAANRINNGGTDANWSSPNLMPNELRLNRTSSAVFGSIYYNTSSLRANPLGFVDSLKNNFYKTPALIPPMRWKDSIAPNVPTNLTATINAQQSNVTLRWTRPTLAADGETAKYYVVYRFLTGETINLEKVAAIRTITADTTTSFVDVFANPAAFVYVVTAVDRLHNESAVSNAVAVGTSRTSDVSLKHRLEPNVPNPFNDFTTVRYALGESGLVNLKIFDISGKQVADLVNERQTVGDYNVEWRPNNLPSGIYIATLTLDGGASVTQRLVYSH
jgi:uncharacterized lipoprotein YddW (UPF0748 family)